MNNSNLKTSIQPINRMTIPMLSVLATLINGEGWYGLRIAEATAMATGTVYPILARFERAGWLESTWEDKEDPDEENDSGARRKYYRLTPDGRERARTALKLRHEALAKANQTSVALRSVLGH